jgi:hypothetical protein
MLKNNELRLMWRRYVTIRTGTGTEGSRSANFCTDIVEFPSLIPVLHKFQYINVIPT